MHILDEIMNGKKVEKRERYLAYLNDKIPYFKKILDSHDIKPIGGWKVDSITIDESSVSIIDGFEISITDSFEVRITDDTFNYFAFEIWYENDEEGWCFNYYTNYYTYFKVDIGFIIQDLTVYDFDLDLKAFELKLKLI